MGWKLVSLQADGADPHFTADVNLAVGLGSAEMGDVVSEECPRRNLASSR